MEGGYVAPVVAEILNDQSAVAAVGGVFATQQDSPNVKDVWGELVFDSPVSHQVDEARLVFVPAQVLVLVPLEQLFSGGEQVRLVDVLGVAEVAEEELEVVSFCESG